MGGLRSREDRRWEARRLGLVDGALVRREDVEGRRGGNWRRSSHLVRGLTARGRERMWRGRNRVEIRHAGDEAESYSCFFPIAVGWNVSVWSQVEKVLEGG